jgi:hypothetical protein
MEKTRKRINRHVRSYFLNKKCYVIKYPDFDDKLPVLFDLDGTHLSFIGNDISINAIQGALETFFKYPLILLGDPIGENTTGRSIVVRTLFHKIPPMRILSELKV